jgi:hypothetical protein
VNQLQLNEVVQRIEHSFGEGMAIEGHSLDEADSEALRRVFHNEACQPHIQDQVNRRIIRDYLVNAVLLGCISDKNFSALSSQAVSVEGRSILSLHMLMKSVEAANDIPFEADLEVITELRPEPGSSPHLVIVGG